MVAILASSAASTVCWFFVADACAACAFCCAVWRAASPVFSAACSSACAFC